MKEIRHLSPSAAQSYRQCGHAFFLNRILGIKNTNVYHTTQFGTAIHLALEIMLKLKKNNKQIPITRVKRIFVTKHRILSKKVTIWKDEDYDHMVEQGLAAIDDFFENVLPELRPLHIEKSFTIGRDGGRPVKMIVDLITADAKVIDIKTGRSSKKENYITNMVTYAWAYQTVFGEWPVSVSLMKIKWKRKQKDYKAKYYFESWEDEAMQIDPTWVQQTMDVYSLVEAGINNNIYQYAADSDFLCRNCGYRQDGYCERKVL